MRVIDFLDKFPSAAEVTFIVRAADGSYRPTPIHSAWEWLNGDELCDYLVINADHPPISADGSLGARYRDGRLHCAMITTEAALLEEYGAEQGRVLIAHYDRPIH